MPFRPYTASQNSKILKEITLFCFIFKLIIKEGYKMRIVCYLDEVQMLLKGYYHIQSQFCIRPFKKWWLPCLLYLYFFNYLLNVSVDPSIQINFFDKLLCTFEWSCNCYINYYCYYMIVYEEKYARCRDPSSKYSSWICKNVEEKYLLWHQTFLYCLLHLLISHIW